MPEKTYSLNTILQTIFTYKNNKVKKRIIYDKSPLGGFSSKWTKILLYILPLAMYAAIFNKSSFEYLGIAQAIVFYIILLVFAMQIVIGVAFFNNRKVVKMVTPSWEHYFPTIDFKMILSSGVTPYIEFINHYEKALNQNLDDKMLYKALKNAVIEMEDENSDLLEAINRDRKKKEGK
ncbi:MAG: hypothetical protein COB07_10950 [Sulfurovum sp.]|nr:MAG: hypothetical protein COB07_10950 [Sulfurovum sp.]